MKRISILLLAFFTCFVLAAWPQAQAHWKHKPKIITFEAPGAGTGPGQGTIPYGIDSQGTIIGPYVDADNVNHGFIRARDGTITTFDVPGAGTSAYQGTVALAINPAGAVTGMYFDANCLYHGFLRDPDGTITTIDVPGANTVGGQCSTNIWWLVMQGTAAHNINAAGTITGIYTDAIGVGHVFLRDNDGTFSTFDASGAGTEAVEGTWTATTYTLNPAGAIAGWYVDSGMALHGYLRTAKGDVSTFDVPGAGTGKGQGTNAGNIGPNGTIFGVYTDAGNVSHGFMRAPQGKISTFDVPAAGSGPGQGTFTGWASCMNGANAVTGWYVDSNNVSHGYLRNGHGIITTFDAPGAGTAAGQGTYSWSINQNEAVTASFVDSNGVNHGFLRAADGSFWVFDVFGAGKGAGQGTVPEGINAKAVIVGNIIDANGVNHGFQRTPDRQTVRFRVPAAGTAKGQGTVPLTNNPSGATTGAYFDSNFVMHGFMITW